NVLHPADGICAVPSCGQDMESFPIIVVFRFEIWQDGSMPSIAGKNITASKVPLSNSVLFAIAG
ncbi:hypothetical protein H9L39_19694, partial [Fusarium oxysporum f. sp. albedinis]